uniref:Pentraxin family member n=1 Tax=Dromaius novaehollandiae TaxID=8790 RepID=A0A8C4KHJ8_DRONO
SVSFLHAFLFLTSFLCRSPVIWGTAWQKTFYFPAENTESSVHVQPLRAMTLPAFTLCFWTKAQRAGTQTVLSYSTPQRVNELVVTVGTDVGLWVGGRFICFPLHHESENWLHYCMAWASQSGMADLRLNGAAGKAKRIQKGYVTQAGGTLVLGKDRDTLPGTSSNGFAGWMTHVNLWGQGLRPADVRTGVREMPANTSWLSLTDNAAGRHWESTWVLTAFGIKKALCKNTWVKMLILS